MPTLVHVRGKKGQKPLIEEAKRRKTMESAAAKQAGHTTRRVKSFLDNLPTEILQEIFILSHNFDLPCTSPVLYAQLNSYHVKRLFVLRCFAHHVENAYRNHVAELAEIQSRLLRCKWLTYPFFRSCQAEFLLKAARARVRSSMEDQEMDKEQMERTMRDMEEKFLSKFDMGSYDPKHGSPWNHFVEDPSPWSYTQISCPGPWYQKSNEIAPGLFLTSGCGDCSILRSGAPGNGKMLAIMPMVARGCKVPQKLVHGQWTQTRGNFLKLLLDGRAKFDGLDASLYEAAQLGLTEAIRQGCFYGMYELMRLDNLCELPPSSKFKVKPTGLVCPNLNHLLECLKKLEEPQHPSYSSFKWLLPMAMDVDGLEAMILEWTTAKTIQDAEKGIENGLGAEVLKFYKETWKLHQEEKKSKAERRGTSMNR